MLARFRPDPVAGRDGIDAREPIDGAAISSPAVTRATTAMGAVFGVSSRTARPMAYSADADLALEVTDPLNIAGGRFLLQIRDGVGKCTRHEGTPDIELGLAELATIYMGAHRAWELLRARRINEVRPAAMDDLDAAFRTGRAPFCGTLF